MHYKGCINPLIGSRTVVVPIDHPSEQVSNTTTVITSPVIRLGAWGEFETENTIYRPEIAMEVD